MLYNIVYLLDLLFVSFKHDIMFHKNRNAREMKIKNQKYLLYNYIINSLFINK